MMNIYMPLLMGYLGLTLASGISLYFVVSNLFGVGQYALLGRVNWKNLNPFYKAQPLPAGKAVAKVPRSVSEPVEKESRNLPESASKSTVSAPLKSNGSGAAKVKKANITKPVKSGTSKIK
jgi:membrane protein insertase Oxa1/YidC/SpoIIIJ